MDKKEPLTMPTREGAPPKQRRVYKTVATGEGDGVFQVLLDGKPALTPMRTALASRSRGLAEAVAAEWDAQDPHIDPETMPLTRLLATALDRVVPQREAVIASLLSYVDADMVCYRASHPADLRDRQNAAWQPAIDGLLRDHDVALVCFQGIMPGTQAPEVANRMRLQLENMDDNRLTAFQAAASSTSSLALGFAFVHGRMTSKDVFAAAFLDELYQAEKWGDDPIARKRRDQIAGELDGIERFLKLIAA